MSELTGEEFDKEFKRLCDELYKSLKKPPLPCSPQPIPPPGWEICARNLHEIRRFVVEKKGLPSGSPYVNWLPDLGSNQGQTD